jgi:predicted enzyme related to lactoylglutathione lyase
MNVSFNSIIIYAKNMKETAGFYVKHFELNAVEKDSLIVLSDQNQQEKIIIHQAAKSVKMGQVCLKLVFSVPNVEKFKNEAKKDGLIFGTTHKGNGYLFANAKDPCKNNISISSREYI